MQYGRFSGQRRCLEQPAFQEWESLLVTWFKQARGSNAVISGSLLWEKSQDIGTRLGTDDFKASKDWINSFKQQHSVVYKTILGECRSVRKWRKEESLKIIGGYEPMNIYNAEETGLFFRFPPNRTWSLTGDPCSDRKNSRERITVLLDCGANETDKLPPLVTEKN